MRKLMILMAACLIFFGNVANIQAENTFQIKRNDQVTVDWEIHMDYPFFDQLENQKLQKSINSKIMNKLNRQVEMVKKRSSEILGIPILYYEETDVIREGDFYSVLMFSHISRGEEYQSSVSSVNFTDGEEGKVQSLKEVVEMGDLNKAVKKAMAQDPEVYDLKRFSKVREDTAFYIRNNQLILIFNKFEVAAGVYGTPEIQIPLEEVKKEDTKKTNAPVPSIL